MYIYIYTSKIYIALSSKFGTSKFNDLQQCSLVKWQCCGILIFNAIDVKNVTKHADLFISCARRRGVFVCPRLGLG